MANIIFINANIGGKWVKDHGGRQRTINLAEALPEHNVTVLLFSWDQEQYTTVINDNLKIIKVAAEHDLIRKRKLLLRSEARLNHDMCVEILKNEAKAFKRTLNKLLPNADLIILDHYSGAPLVENITEVPIFYNSQNSEITMARQLHPDDDRAVEIVRKMEASALSNSVAFGYCSKEDLAKIQHEYGVDDAHAYYMPNGSDKKQPISPETRLHSKNIMFVGSSHPPNAVAVKNIVSIASRMPDYTFTIAGSISGSITARPIPKNVIPLGHVNNDVLVDLFSTSLAFINPMESGSGTHLKMMESLSYGIPIVSSPVGARGFSEEEKKAMLICETEDEFMIAIESLSDSDKYKKIVDLSLEVFEKYDWQTVKKNFANDIDDVIKNHPIIKDVVLDPVDPSTIPGSRKKVLVYSIVRNRQKYMRQYYKQLVSMVSSNPNYEFYLSIYENDSNDNTVKELMSNDWSMFAGVSLIFDKLDTEYFGSVKHPARVENLAKARNKAIEAGGFLDKVDYVLMIDSDLKFDNLAVSKLLSFDSIEPDFDIVSSISLRPNGTHYDWWATRTGPIFNEKKSEIDPQWKIKSYGAYYSTSNGLCLYRAKPFQEGARYGWINSVTGEFDCEAMIVCQVFREMGYNKIYIRYDSRVYT